MAKYKSVIIRSNDSIQDISERYLGDASKWFSIATLNRLRSPYISDDPEDQLGQKNGEIYIPSELLKGSTYIKLPKSLYSVFSPDQGFIAKNILAPNNIIFAKKYLQNGDYYYDNIKIRKVHFYATDYTKSFVSMTNDEFLIEFESNTISSPSISALDQKLVSFSYYSIGTAKQSEYVVTGIGTSWDSSMIGATLFFPSMGNLSATILSVESSTSLTVDYSRNIGNDPFSPVKYSIQKSFFSESFSKIYVTYSYVTANGKETIVAPFNEVLIDGSYVAEYIKAGPYSTITFSSPSVWPTGVTAVNVYIGNDTLRSSLKLQATLLAPSSSASINIDNGLIANGKNPEFPSSSNDEWFYNEKPKIGILNSYVLGSKFTFHEPYFDDTYVLKTGDIIRIPMSSQQGSVASYYSDKTILDAYGKDIALNSNGQISFTGNSSTDILNISGRKNVIQSLNNRLLTRYGSLKSFPSYGNSSFKYAGSKYSATIVKSVKDSLINSIISDPRIESIISLDVRYDSDSSAIIADNIYIRLVEDSSAVNLYAIEIGF